MQQESINTDIDKWLNQIIEGDCLEVLKELPNNSIDSIVTDPPYELNFMNKSWDNTGIAHNVELWRECLRVLKPGGHLLSFGGSRTYHRMACAIEDAGFEIRDQIMWIYGSGMPKSMDISKAIDKKFGAKRTEIIGRSPYEGRRPNSFGGKNNGDICYEDHKAQPEMPILAPATPEVQQWNGWGTCLKPAHEPIVMARKPLSEKTIVGNVLKWDTGGINIDGCRIETYVQPYGRFPANIILDEEAGEMLDEQSGILKSGFMKAGHPYGKGTGQNVYGKLTGKTQRDTHGDSGGASRFFKQCNYNEGENSWQELQWYVQYVKKNLLIMNAIIESIVLKNVTQSPNMLIENLANYAEVQLKTIDIDIVLKNVVTLQNQGDSQLSNMIALFMREMLNVLKQKDEISIGQMQNTGKKLEQELRHTLMEMLKCNHVKYAEIQLLINIMMIIQNLLNTDGCVENATLHYMWSNMEVGEKDYQTANRFMYCAKASKAERGEGNNHPTVKPIALMRYLARLITPPEGLMLDPFAGSGTTLVASKLEGFFFIGIEKELKYVEIAQKRINQTQVQQSLFNKE